MDLHHFLLNALRAPHETVSAAPPAPAEQDPVEEQLVEEARTRRPSRPSARDLWVTGVLAAGFLAVAGLIAITVPGHRAASPLLVALMVGAYALVSRVELEVGPGSAVPTQLVFVPMLFTLPVSLVPLVIAGAYVLGALPDYLARRVHPARLLVLLAGSWFSVGPALILGLFAQATPTWRDAPLYVGALAAQWIVDYASSAARQRIAFGHSLRALLPAFAFVWAVDGLLTPVALVAAATGVASLLVAVPAGALLALLARDRRIRIDRAVAADRAFRTAQSEAHRDDLTGLANRRKLLADLDAALATAGAESETELLLVIYDLNGFKYYNDTFGHPAGDALLQRLGRRLGDAATPYGSSYRLGGDEFCVLANVSASAAETLLDATTGALAEDGDGFSVSTCFGAVFLPSEATDPRTALQIADRRLYAQKHGARLGRGQPHEVLLAALGERDPDLDGHVKGVASLAAAVGRRLGLEASDVEELVVAAQLHDVGKLAIPDAVLEKPGRLDQSEWALIRQHTVIGQRILSAVPALHKVGAIVRSTHERWDGNGYVDGLAGGEIPLAARIIAVCDAFSAMTSDRPYQDAMTPEAALAELARCAGSQFDPEVVHVLDAVLTDHPGADVAPSAGAERRVAGRSQ
jgi:diguanylate cyclase (GGDEF)-like protein